MSIEEPILIFYSCYDSNELRIPIFENQSLYHRNYQPWLIASAGELNLTKVAVLDCQWLAGRSGIFVVNPSWISATTKHDRIINNQPSPNQPSTNHDKQQNQTHDNLFEFWSSTIPPLNFNLHEVSTGRFLSDVHPMLNCLLQLSVFVLGLLGNPGTVFTGK